MFPKFSISSNLKIGHSCFWGATLHNQKRSMCLHPRNLALIRQKPLGQPHRAQLLQKSGECKVDAFRCLNHLTGTPFISYSALRCSHAFAHQPSREALKILSLPPIHPLSNTTQGFLFYIVFLFMTPNAERAFIKKKKKKYRMCMRNW